MPQEEIGIRGEDTGADGLSLAARPDAQGQAGGVGAPTAKNGNGAGAFSARARQRAESAEDAIARGVRTTRTKSAVEDADDSAGKRGRKMMSGVKRAHGWRVQEGKRDGG